MADALSYMAEEARRLDRDRFLCTLFAPEDRRTGLFVLLAFNAEIAKAREMVSEAMLGEIRLQWWRDSIERIYANPDGDFSDQAVVAELAQITKKYNLSRTLFDQLIDARSRDMIDEPPKDAAELLSYAAATTATLNVLMMEVLGTCSKEELKAAEHVGAAWSLTGILRASSILAKYKRVYMPQSLMLEGGFDDYEFMAQKPTPAIAQATHQVVELAQVEIGKARALMGSKAGKAQRAVFLQASLAELYLRRILKFDCNPFHRKIEAGRAGRQLKLTFKAVRGSF